MNEVVIHSNIQNIAHEDLQELKGYYSYVNHRLLKSLQILKEITVEKNEDGSSKKRSIPDNAEYIISIEQIRDLRNLLEDLEHRLRRMFIDTSIQETVDISDGYVKGPLRRGRGRPRKN